jgi:hypothetical protein
MPDIQHQDARKLLRVISLAWKSGNTFTYRKAAELIGREPAQNHSRAIAQICDLLDAAACFAGVPLLALIVVREQSGDINRRAWKNELACWRDAIIQRSLAHRFRTEDFKAISAALDGLRPAREQSGMEVFGEDGLHRRFVMPKAYRKLCG